MGIPSITVVLVFCAALSGCAGNKPVMPVLAEPAVSDVDRAVLAGINRIAVSYAQLSLISKSLHERENIKGYDTESLPSNWALEMNLLNDYHGRLSDFVVLMSTMVGLLEPKILSAGFGKPVLITMRSGSRQFIDFLADAGYQAGERATVTADIANNKILLTYK